jgi:cysteine desulfurase
MRLAAGLGRGRPHLEDRVNTRGISVETIYMDHNATTPTDPRVVEAMLPFFSERFGNPSSPYAMAQETRRAVEWARRTVAEVISCRPEEIVFTSGGSESDNIAIKGTALRHLAGGGHIITSKIEHHAVVNTCDYLRRNLGFDVSYLPVDSSGLVDPADLVDSLRDDTLLISIMQVNNEVGTIQPLEEIGRIARDRGIPLHTDAVQAVGKIPVDVDALCVDFLAMSAHKFYGPKGVGALYVRKGARFDALSHGGGQERGMRPGTENTPGIVGLATALELAADGMEEEGPRLRRLTERLIDGLTKRISDLSLNGSRDHLVPGTANLAFRYVEGESVVLSLDMEGFAVSTGSACTTDSPEPSHVLSAMGIAPNVAQGSVRFGLGRGNTDAHVDRLLEVMPGILKRLRAISPLVPKEKR